MRWTTSARALTTSTREAQSFELLKAGDLRAHAGYLCLEQLLGYDCSALLIYMADLERALEACGNRGYRDAHLEAGILGGRAYLASYALDRGATGLTFYDDETTKFLSPHAAGKSPLLMVAIGVPRVPVDYGLRTARFLSGIIHRKKGFRLHLKF